MGLPVRRLLSTSFLAVAFLTVANSQMQVPTLWNDASLADWATPIAGLGFGPRITCPAGCFARTGGIFIFEQGG
jgi:hypothetical protein